MNYEMCIRKKYVLQNAAKLETFFLPIVANMDRRTSASLSRFSVSQTFCSDTPYSSGNAPEIICYTVKQDEVC